MLTPLVPEEVVPNVDVAELEVVLLFEYEGSTREFTHPLSWIKIRGNAKCFNPVG